jgi:hypothetical protein
MILAVQRSEAPGITQAGTSSMTKGRSRRGSATKLGGNPSYAGTGATFSAFHGRA